MNTFRKKQLIENSAQFETFQNKNIASKNEVQKGKVSKFNIESSDYERDNRVQIRKTQKYIENRIKIEKKIQNLEKSRF